jgi:hypothetical protein
LITASAPLKGRVQEILTVEQHNKLQPMVRQDRPGVGRAGALRGGGARAFRGRGGRMGAPGQRHGIRGGVGIRWGGSGQGSFLPPRARGARPGVGSRSARPYRRGRGIGLPLDSGKGWNLP